MNYSITLHEANNLAMTMPRSSASLTNLIDFLSHVVCWAYHYLMPSCSVKASIREDVKAAS